MYRSMDHTVSVGHGFIIDFWEKNAKKPIHQEKKTKKKQKKKHPPSPEKKEKKKKTLSDQIMRAALKAVVQIVLEQNV